jgi:PEP-CTERM motif
MFRLRELRPSIHFVRLALVLTIAYTAQTPVSAALVATPITTTTSFTGNILFNFNVGTPANTTVQAYFNSVAPGLVTVVQSGNIGANWGNGWNGDGHVVGPWLGYNPNITPNISPNTNFLITVQNGATDTIQLLLSQPIYGISFNYEIFPNADDPDGTVPGSVPPDFTFNAGSPGDVTTYLHAVGVLPPASSNELAPQLFGSASFSFPNGVTELDFVDWPATIGIGGIIIDLDAPATSTPEPGTLLLFAAVLGGAGFGANRRRMRA